MYLDIADRLAKESHAVRLKVGAVFVSPDGVMSTGINGLPPGGDNLCEYETWVPRNEGKVHTVTKPEVSHAEENLFSKLMKQGVSTKDGAMFLTHAPCIHCAKIIVGAGIREVYYTNEYRAQNGVDWLKKNNVLTKSKVDFVDSLPG